MSRVAKSSRWRASLQRLLETGDNPLGDVIGVACLFILLFVGLFAAAVFQ